MTKVGLHLARKNLESGGFADTVGTNQTKHLTRTRNGQTMQLERIGRITMRHFRFQVGRQVDNVDGAKRTFLGTDTTTNTKRF